MFVGREPQYVQIVCELDNVKEGLKLSIVSKAEDTETGKWENKEQIFLGEKRMAPARLAQILKKHPMNGERYHLLYNNCQKWLECFLGHIDSSFIKNLPKQFQYTVVGQCLDATVGSCLDALKEKK